MQLLSKTTLAGIEIDISKQDSAKSCDFVGQNHNQIAAALRDLGVGHAVQGGQVLREQRLAGLEALGLGRPALGVHRVLAAPLARDLGEPRLFHPRM